MSGMLAGIVALLPLPNGSAQLSEEQAKDVRLAIVGAIVGAILSGWGLLYPWSRLAKGVYVTAAAESNFKRGAEGDAGASLGILQFNQVNADLLKQENWRADPWFSGYAVPRYWKDRVKRGDGVEGWGTSPLIASLREGTPGLAAWRSAWVRGRVYTPNDASYVGTIAAQAWSDTGASFRWLTVVQVLLIAVAVVLAPPIVAPAIVAVAVVGWLR